MAQTIQIKRSTVAGSEPVAGSLAPGELAVEMGTTPPRLWVGVPVGVDATGRRLVADLSVGGGGAPLDSPIFTGRVGINQNTAALPTPLVPGEALRVVSADNASAAMVITAFGGTTAVPSLAMAKTSGTPGALGGTLDGDNLGGVTWGGYRAGFSWYMAQAAINAYAVGDWSASARATRLVFSTASAAALNPRMELRQGLMVGTGLVDQGPGTVNATGYFVNNEPLTPGGAGGISSITFSPPLTGGTIQTTGTVGLGQVPVGLLGTGAATATTFLRGDGTWATPAGGALPAPGPAGSLLGSNGTDAAYTLTPGPLTTVTVGPAGTAIAAPPSRVYVTGATNEFPTINIDAYGVLPAPTLYLSAARGTVSAPTPIQLNDPLGLVASGGAPGYGQSAVVQFSAAETFTATAHGGQIDLRTATLGTTTLVTRMSLQAGLMIGNPSPDPGQGGVNINRNTAAPPAPLTDLSLRLIGADATSARMTVEQFGAGGGISFLRAGGTAAAPTPLVNGNGMGNLQWWGWNGTDYGGNAASINCSASENWSPTARGTQLTFGTTPNGTTANHSTNMTLDGSGNLTVVGGLYVNAVSAQQRGATVSWLAGANPNGGILLVADRALEITLITGIPEVLAGAAAACTLYKAPSGVALSAGTAVTALDAFNANVNAGTYQTIGISVPNLAPGDRLGVVTTGAWTASVGSISVTVQ